MEEVPSQLQPILYTYSDVFQEPASLPPSRGTFPLKEGANTANRRPYRHTLKHKDLIEKLVKETLDKGVIQLSSSPFASSVILVREKDGT